MVFGAKGQQTDLSCWAGQQTNTFTPGHFFGVGKTQWCPLFPARHTCGRSRPQSAHRSAMCKVERGLPSQGLTWITITMILARSTKKKERGVSAFIWCTQSFSSFAGCGCFLLCATYLGWIERKRSPTLILLCEDLNVIYTQDVFFKCLISSGGNEKQ